MEAVKYLFICSANRNRSKAAERICKDLAQAKGKNIECQSAGVHELAERRVTKYLADWADRIFVMEEYMQDILVIDYEQKPEKIIVFDIPDIYGIYDPVLEQILIKKIEKYV
jgi:predicted protein tyrosine phosphatase